MSLSTRVLAVPGALLLLAGCRHKQAPAAKPAPAQSLATQATPAPPQPDPLASLRPHLAEAFAKVRTAAGPLGLLGWPGVATLDGPDESNPTLERLFFHNDRALVFVDKSTGRYSAFVLMPESKSTEELHYWPVWVHDLFGSPKLERVTFENPDRNKFDATDGAWWAGDDSTRPGEDGIRDRDETRLYTTGPFELVAGTRNSDATAKYLAGATPTILDFVDGIWDAQYNLEGSPDGEVPVGFRPLPRKDLESATKLGTSIRFVWFTANGKKYAAKKGSLDTWMKGPQPPDTTTP